MDLRRLLLIVPVPSSGGALGRSFASWGGAGWEFAGFSPWKSCIDAALRDRSLPRFLLQHCSHQHKLPDAAEPEL